MIQVSRTSRHIIRKLDPVYELLSPLAYPMIRLAVGIMMIPHGYAKLFNEVALKEPQSFFLLLVLNLRSFLHGMLEL